MNPPAPSADRDQLKNAKIAVLRLINENRDILFGKLSDTLSREAKEAKWAEVAEHAHALGAFPSHRSWDYLKDTTWQNWRKRFVEKREKKDKYEKTGIGTKIIYDEADLLINEILEALGRNGPSSQSNQNYLSPPNNTHFRDISEVLEIEFETKAEDINDEIFQEDHLINGGMVHANYMNPAHEGAEDYEDNNGYHNDDEEIQEYLSNDSKIKGSSSSVRLEASGSPHPKIVSTSSLSSAASTAAIFRKYAAAGYRTGGNFNRKRSANTLNSNSGPNNSIERELTELKCKKIRAELELLERESYKKDLEILQLERSLGLSPSYITDKFYNRVDRRIINGRLNRQK